ncbi:MAG: hypothetical protein VR70_04925 [Rhodospirillaceae bacterium BRH_c57]|nr:MAG: hypothetical protein VR70_04925 [Rhodospirillaceae bacterium BRH_c57]
MNPSPGPQGPLPLVARLTTDHGVPLVDDASLPTDAGLTAVFLPGASGESGDVAVVLPELLKAFAGRLSAAVAAPEAEAALAARFAVFVTPALVFLRGGEQVGALTKVRDWAVYRDTIQTLLEAR